MAVNVKKCAVSGVLWGQARRNGSDKVLSSKMMKMLQQRLEIVKIYNTLIAFPHPHTEPYRYLGVDITSTFNWAPHLDTVLKEARQKGERLLMSPLSIKEKAQALDTVIGSCMASSMPLGLMTLSDVSKCDPPQDHLACGLSDCLSNSRSAVQFPVFRNLVYELTAGQVGTGFAWKLYICCAAATPVSGTRVASGLHLGTPKGVKAFFQQV